MKIFTTTLVFFLLMLSAHLFADDAEKNSALDVFFTQLKIEQGVANFTQKKHFTFLANPIVSKGLLKIHQSSVIWQVQSPVFSKLVIVDDQVWQQVGDDPAHYQAVVSHASVETLIRAVFTGDINRTQWDVSLDAQQCLQLSPKDLVLSQAIQQITVCLPNNAKQRFVTIKDAQSNLTEIELNITAEHLSDEDIREFIINK